MFPKLMPVPIFMIIYNNTSQDIPLWTKNVNMLWALEKKSQDH